VVAVLHTLGAPDKLSHLIEGESLLNDGTAYVVFAIFLEFAGGVDLTGGDIVLKFLQLSLGGPLWGLAMGLGAGYAMRLPGAHGDPLTEISLLVCGVYTTFFVAEHHLHVSGVLAVVAFGVYLGKEREIVVGRSTERRNHEFWEMVGFLANSFIFVLSGLVIYNKLFDMEAHHRGVNLGSCLAMYVVLHAVRGCMVYGMFAAGLKDMGYGINMNEAHVMVYGGLRGAVGLALAMEVEHDQRIDPAVRETVMVQVGGIVALTLLINGTTAGLFYEYLNPYPEVPYRESLTVRALIQLDIEVHGSKSRHLTDSSSNSRASGLGMGMDGHSPHKKVQPKKKQRGDAGLLHHLAESPFHGFADYPTVRSILPDVARVTRLGHVLVLDRDHPDVNADGVIDILESLEIFSSDAVLAEANSKQDRVNAAKSKVGKFVLGAQGNSPWGHVKAGVRLKNLSDGLQKDRMRRRSTRKVMPAQAKTWQKEGEDDDPHQNQLRQWIVQQKDVVQGNSTSLRNGTVDSESNASSPTGGPASPSSSSSQYPSEPLSSPPKIFGLKLPAIGTEAKVVPVALTGGSGSSPILTAPQPISTPADPADPPAVAAPQRASTPKSLANFGFGRGASREEEEGRGSEKWGSSTEGKEDEGEAQVSAVDATAAAAAAASAETKEPSPDRQEKEQEVAAARDQDEEEGSAKKEKRKSERSSIDSGKFLQVSRTHMKATTQVGQIADMQAELKDALHDLTHGSSFSSLQTQKSVDRVKDKEPTADIVAPPTDHHDGEGEEEEKQAAAAAEGSEEEKQAKLDGAEEEKGGGTPLGASRTMAPPPEEEKAQVEWAEKAAIGGLFGNINSEMKVTVWEVVLKAMEMQMGAMYEHRTISGAAYQRLVECVNLAVDSLPLHEAAAVSAEAAVAAAAAHEQAERDKAGAEAEAALLAGTGLRRRSVVPFVDTPVGPPSSSSSSSALSAAVGGDSLLPSHRLNPGVGDDGGPPSPGRAAVTAKQITSVKNWKKVQKFVLVESVVNQGFGIDGGKVAGGRRGSSPPDKADHKNKNKNKKKAFNPFQVAWNMLEHSVDTDLDTAVQNSKNKALYRCVRSMVPPSEQGLTTSVQALMGFIAAVEKTSRSISSSAFESIFAEDPTQILEHLARESSSSSSSTSESFNDVTPMPKRRMSGKLFTDTKNRRASVMRTTSQVLNEVKGNKKMRLPIVSWVLKQLKVVKLQAYGTLAAMRLMFPAELRVIHTMLATEIALGYMREKVRLLCDQGLLTHHTLEDILEVIKRRHEKMHRYHLRFL
jgi:hypothetical protein